MACLHVELESGFADRKIAAARRRPKHVYARLTEPAISATNRGAFLQQGEISMTPA
jgi:hypothetical protein